MTGRLGANDPRLSDPNWLARMYSQHGDMWIALEIGADRKTIRKRREQFGIQSAPPGRRRGVSIANTTQRGDRTIARIIARASRIDNAAPGRALEHFAAADRARRDHDRVSERIAWEHVAATAIRIAQRLDQLEA